LASIDAITLAAHKLINWVFQKCELDQKYNPGHLNVDRSLSIEGEGDTNSIVRIENVKVSPKEPSVKNFSPGPKHLSQM